MFCCHWTVENWPCKSLKFITTYYFNTSINVLWIIGCWFQDRLFHGKISWWYRLELCHGSDTLFWSLQQGCFATEDCSFGLDHSDSLLRCLSWRTKCAWQKKRMQVEKQRWLNLSNDLPALDVSLFLTEAGERLHWWTVDELGLITFSFLISDNMEISEAVWIGWPIPQLSNSVNRISFYNQL